MPRPFIFLILFALLVAGGVYALSTLPEEQPSQVVEVDVDTGGNAN